MLYFRPHILGATAAALGEWAAIRGWHDRIAREVVRAIHHSAPTEIDPALRLALEEDFDFRLPTITEVFEATDGTLKLQIDGFYDGSVEAVVMPTAEGDIVCISSQTGCAMGCAFCLTGQNRRHRNLTTAELLGQVYVALAERRRRCGMVRLSRIQFMGMGEPLMNYDSVKTAIDLLQSDDGFSLRGDQILVSTVGIAPRLRELLEQTNVDVALSLHGPDDATRSQLVTVNKKWNVETLVATLEAMPPSPRRRLTIHYVMVAEVNDAPEQAALLADRLSHIDCRIELIAMNAHPQTRCQPASEERMQAFAEALRARGRDVGLRMPRGRDINADCGLLQPRQPSV